MHLTFQPPLPPEVIHTVSIFADPRAHWRARCDQCTWAYTGKSYWLVEHRGSVHEQQLHNPG